jgi:hypothetical protein
MVAYEFQTFPIHDTLFIIPTMLINKGTNYFSEESSTYHNAFSTMWNSWCSIPGVISCPNWTLYITSSIASNQIKLYSSQKRNFFPVFQFYRVESRYFSANINRTILSFLLIGLMVFSMVTLSKCFTLWNLLGNVHRQILAMFSSCGSTATRVTVFFRSAIDFRFTTLSILFVVIRDCADDLQ